MLTEAYHVAWFDRQKRLDPRDLERMLYPPKRARQSEGEVERRLVAFFDRYEKARGGNG